MVYSDGPCKNSSHRKLLFVECERTQRALQAIVGLALGIMVITCSRDAKIRKDKLTCSISFT